MVFVPPTFIAEYRVARKFSLLSTNGWWLNRWPLLGWLETGLKVLAWFYSSYVGIETVPIHKPKYGSEPAVFVLQTFLMCGGTTLLTLAVVDRLRYREVVSMIFVFPNAWAHWVVVSAMLRLGPAGLQARNFRMFCWLMLSGDIVKLLFFAVHDFTMLEVKRYILYLLVLAFAVLYSVVLLLSYGYLTVICSLIWTILGEYVEPFLQA